MSLFDAMDLICKRTEICLSRIFLRSGLAVHMYLAGKPLPQKAFAEGTSDEEAVAVSHSHSYFTTLVISTWRALILASC